MSDYEAYQFAQANLSLLLFHQIFLLLLALGIAVVINGIDGFFEFMTGICCFFGIVFGLTVLLILPCMLSGNPLCGVFVLGISMMAVAHWAERRRNMP